MEYRRILSVAAGSLLGHKIRSSLTMLGIIFGVAAVIAMLSIGEGARQDALEQIELLGINNIIIKATPPTEGKGSEDVGGRSEGLTLADADNFRAFPKLINDVIPCQVAEKIKIFYADKETDAQLIATVPDYLNIRNLGIERGSFIRDRDRTGYQQVCIIGPTVKRRLFGFEDPLGKKIRISDRYFTVIGVTVHKAHGGGEFQGTMISDVNNNIYIPLETAARKLDRELETSVFHSNWSDWVQKNFNKNELDQIIVAVGENQDIGIIADLVRRVLERRHRGIPDYEVIVPEALLEQSRETQRIFNIVMGAIAGISLLVGGIGIMNIMLATVLERTREIGVRRAVGAKRFDIMNQFLIEAVMICLFGCAIGVILGVGLARSISAYADWRTIISIWSIVLAVGVSTGVGVVFGFYPARKAALLDPIEALRYE